MGNVYEEYQNKICPTCIHNDDKDYYSCKIVRIDSKEARCTDYKERENNGGN